jgi:hypothetical protein
MEKRHCCLQKGWPRLYAVTEVEFGQAGMGGMEKEWASMGPGCAHPADFDFCDSNTWMQSQLSLFRSRIDYQTKRILGSGKHSGFQQSSTLTCNIDQNNGGLLRGASVVLMRNMGSCSAMSAVAAYNLLCHSDPATQYRFLYWMHEIEHALIYYHRSYPVLSVVPIGNQQDYSKVLAFTGQHVRLMPV